MAQRAVDFLCRDRDGDPRPDIRALLVRLGVRDLVIENGAAAAAKPAGLSRDGLKSFAPPASAKKKNKDAKS